MIFSRRLITFVGVLVVIGLGAYIWFVTVPSLTCTDESRERERAYEEHLLALSKNLDTMEKLLIPMKPNLSGDEIKARIDNYVDETTRTSNLAKLALNKYLTAIEKSLDCKPIF